MSYKSEMIIFFFQASREKCARCDRAIMESTLKALGQVYHPDCFVCSMCPKSLEGIEFFVTEENKPLCKEDFARYVIIYRCHTTMELGFHNNLI